MHMIVNRQINIKRISKQREKQILFSTHAENKISNKKIQDFKRLGLLTVKIAVSFVLVQLTMIPKCH